VRHCRCSSGVEHRSHPRSAPPCPCRRATPSRRGGPEQLTAPFVARACSLGAHAACTDRGRPPPRTGRPCCGTTEGWPNKPSRSGPVPDTASVAATACRHRASFQSLPQSPTPSRPSSPPFANSCPLAEYAPSSTYAIDLKPPSRFAPARLPSERARPGSLDRWIGASLSPLLSKPQSPRFIPAVIPLSARSG
jgi:hypothetical protein